MFLCKQFLELDKMFSRISDVLQTAADVIAPPPSTIQEFEYHWKQVKNFYSSNSEIPKLHISNTNLPHHLDKMLEFILKTEDTGADEANIPNNDCLEFVLINRPLDLLAQLSVVDSPPGVKKCVLNWTRRLLSCIENPPIDHASLFQPIQTLVKTCNGKKASPYEEEEILFLETVAGLVRKDPFLVNLFLPSHQHSAEVICSLRGIRSKKQPSKNSLFECSKLETNIRRIEIVRNEKVDKSFEEETKSGDTPDENCDIRSVSSRSEALYSTNSEDQKCDCDHGDRFFLLDAILTYFESPDSKIIVRACEGALIITSLPTTNTNCSSICASLDDFITFLISKLIDLCERIPDDMDPGDIEETNVAWGLIPKDSDCNHFIGKAQLHEFLCWLDYTNCVARECKQLISLRSRFRNDFLMAAVEPNLLSIDTTHMLVLASKIIKQCTSFALVDEIANWLVGESASETYAAGDCLLNIVMENAHENSDILLAALQFIEALLDNPHERVLHEMVFRYVNTRGYYDMSSANVHSWSDEEDERERRRGSADGPIKSKTLAPHNILKVINNFLCLLPRQIMCESSGTCYEEYVQDASRHYKLWIRKTQNFTWPVEAVSLEKDEYNISFGSPNLSFGLRKKHPKSSVETKEAQCSDSGISEESFYEGPLLKMLFTHVRNMAFQPCEVNLAVIAILSKLAFLPHPYLHEILLNPEIPVAHGASTLWNSMQILARQLLLEVPKEEGFQKKIGEAGKRLLSNPPMLCENFDEKEHLFEAIVVLEEFCKELAAITFVKYHHATE